MAPYTFNLCTLWLLVTAVVALAQNTLDQRGLTAECLGNIMLFRFDGSLVDDNHLEVDALNGSTFVPLTPTLAAKCGYSIDSDPWGNTKVYTSLLGCFSQNKDDTIFNIGLRFRMYGTSESVYEVKKTCENVQWASREILCERNFMEVSIDKFHPELDVPNMPNGANKRLKHPTDEEISTTIDNIWRMVFYTPVEKPMKIMEVQNAGYGISAMPTRLVLRSPYNMPELYTETVSGVQMKVLKVNTYFKWAWSVTLLDTSAVCPTGGLYFTDDIITWYMPRYITPLMSLRTYVIIELYMGIDGRRLSQEQMNTKGYNLTMTETQIIMKLPFGGPDGYYKSHALGYKYHITYSIEPMLEMLWLAGQSAYTRYKVHYPIISPRVPRTPFVTDNTVEGSEMFEIMVGPFLKDVELMNITFPTGVMTPEAANDRGFNVKQHTFYNGSKAFSISVPFSDPAVQKSNIKHKTTHTLSLIFGLIILPEHTPFPHPAVVTAKGKDVLLPTVSARCDDKNFYITVAHEELGKAFDMMVGGRDLGPDLYREYDVKENSTHLSMTLPFLARDAAFEFAFQSSLRSRIDLLLHDPGSNWHIKNFSMACNFPMSMTECFSNGSIAALAVKLESGPKMVPSKLTLKDPSCKPTFMNDRFAYFNFDANSCGTTRMFSGDVMTYENEIVMSDETNPSDEQNYRAVVSCSYKLSDAKVLDYSATPQQIEIMAEPGFGELEVRMRLAKNSSYKSFYVKEDYPIVQFLKQPLFFEVELLQSTDPRIELVLDNCWASDAGQTISWDVIVDGCINPSDRYQTTFYHVLADERVLYPSHVKRFRVKMFAFFKDNEPVQDPIFIHCETLICDIYDADSVCMKQCPLPEDASTNRVDGRIRHDQPDRMQVSSGKILLSSV